MRRTIERVTYFADLSPYRYVLQDRYHHHVEQPDAVNVGWLSRDHEFRSGPAPPWLIPGLLAAIAGGLVNVTRGFHICDLCPGATRQRAEMEFNGRREFLGNGEIRIRSVTGTLYAAPSLIPHYVAEHHYLPPDAFTEAIRPAGTSGRTAPCA